jgi:hypothetical protein
MPIRRPGVGRASRARRSGHRPRPQSRGQSPSGRPMPHSCPNGSTIRPNCHPCSSLSAAMTRAPARTTCSCTAVGSSTTNSVRPVAPPMESGLKRFMSAEAADTQNTASPTASCARCRRPLRRSARPPHRRPPCRTRPPRLLDQPRARAGCQSCPLILRRRLVSPRVSPWRTARHLLPSDRTDATGARPQAALLSRTTWQRADYAGQGLVENTFRKSLYLRTVLPWNPKFR